MDVLAIQILQLFIADRNILATSLERKFDMTKGQVEYQIKKINLELEENHLGQIQKSGHLYILGGDNVQITKYLSNVSPIIQFSRNERSCYIYLIVLLHANETLQSLADRLNVSKNTIFADKKRLQDYLNDYEIKLDFSRKKGFYFTGEEIEIRKIGIQFIRQIEDSMSDDTLAIIGVDVDILADLKEKILEIERSLDLEFTEYKRADLYLVCYMCYVRYGSGNLLKKGALGSYIQMVENDFYQKVACSLQPFFTEKDQPSDEIRFLSIQILSTNLVKSRSNYRNKELVAKLEKFVSLFEISGITELKDKEQLINELYQHIIPTYYRIKFGLPDEQLLNVDNIKNYQFIYRIVRKSIGILEDYLTITFPEGELFYIAIIMLSFINEETFNLSKKKAIVVCQHGVSVSKLLLEDLKQLFPQIDFIGNMSIREFYAADSANMDLVFSTIPVKTTKESLLIKPLLSDSDKLQLKKKVEQKLQNYSDSDTGKENQTIQGILAIIKKNTNIISEDNLINELEDYVLNSQLKSDFRNEQLLDPSLAELLLSSHIQIYDSVHSVEDAIRIASKPLVNENYITKDYVQKMVGLYDPLYPYTVISPEVAIPHASPRDGVKKVGISFLKLENPCKFAQGIFIRYFFIIAPKDKKSHMKAVTQLYDLVQSNKFMTDLKKIRYERDLKRYFDSLEKDGVK